MSKRCTAFDTRYNIDDNDLVLLKSLDPTGSKCLYLDFIYRQYNERYLTSDTFDEFKLYLQLFEDNKSHLKEKDINAYNLISLRELFYVTLENHVVGSVNTLYDGPYGTLSIPLTHDASCKLGSGTKWCTSSKNGISSFDEYNNTGPLYVWYDNNWNKGTLKELGNRSKKFQFHFETATFMDEYDINIGDNILRYYIQDHPVISLIFEEYENNIQDDNMMVDYVARVDINNIMHYVDKYILDNTTREKKYIKKLGYLLDPDLLDTVVLVDSTKRILSKYLDDEKLLPIIGKLDPSILEEFIYPYVNRSFKYARNIGRPIGIKDIDVAILLDPKYTYDYYLLMDTIPERIETDNIIVNAIINRDRDVNILELDKLQHDAAMLYATDVIRSRCIGIEHGSISYKYKKLFIIPQLIMYGNEEEYLKQYEHPNVIDYKKYCKKHGRSDIVDRHLLNDEKYGKLIEIAMYCYNAPLSYCLSHLDPDIESKIKDEIYYDMYMYVFYGIGKPQNTEWILRRMIANGETKELYDELCNIGTLHIGTDGLNSFSEVSRDGLNYISVNSKFLSFKTLSYIYLGYRPSNYDKLLETTYQSTSFYDELIVYQLYWKKFLNGISMPLFKDIIYNDVYLDNYNGKIDKYENMTDIPFSYLKTRVRR